MLDYSTAREGDIKIVSDPSNADLIGPEDAVHIDDFIKSGLATTPAPAESPRCECGGRGWDCSDARCGH
jgi:hypothetical protein